MRKNRDEIYRNGGDQLLLNALDDGSGGCTAMLPIALHLSDAEVGASDQHIAGSRSGCSARWFSR